MTRARTPSTMLCTRGFSVCCETASRASSSGSPARTRVASWRVKRVRSAVDTRLRRLKERWRLASFCATSLTATGRSCCSRKSCRMWRGVSPSRMPVRSLPPASSAVYSNAPMFVYWLKSPAASSADIGCVSACQRRGFGTLRGRKSPEPVLSIFTRNTQHLFNGGFAAQHAGAAVIADGGGRGAGMALDLLLRGAVMDHGAHGVIRDDQLVDTRAAAVAAGGVTAGTVEHRRGFVRLEVKEAPLVLPGLEGLLGIGA